MTATHQRLRKKVPKKIQARERHRLVAEVFQKWLEENPKVGRKRRLSMFDTFCDSALLNEELKK